MKRGFSGITFKLFLKVFKKNSFTIASFLLIASPLKLLILIFIFRLIIRVISNILTPVLTDRLINKPALKVKIYLKIADEDR